MAQQSKYALPPSPRMPAMAQTFCCWWRPLQYLEYCRRNFGPRFTVHSPSQPPLVFLSDPEEILALFKAPADVLHPGEGGEAILPIVGEDSFMLCDQERHMHGRRSLAPAFHSRAVAGHIEMVRSVAERELALWPLHRPVAVHDYLRTLTLEVILRTIFAGSELTDEDIRVLRERVLALLSITSSLTLIQPYMRHGPRGRAIWGRFLTERERVDEMLHVLIDRRRSSVPQFDGAHTADPLALLLDARDRDGQAFCDGQIRDNIMSLILAGHETTSSELAWAFQLLTHNRPVLERLRREIDADRQDVYMTATIHEVLRHRPVFLFAIPRAVKRPIQIGATHYSPGTHLLGCIYLVHHDPEIYAEPLRFSPERFLENPPRPQTWLPWGGGRKRCPGLHMAMLEMKVVLSTVLSRLTVSPASKRMEQACWRSVIVTPNRGSRVLLSRR